MKNHPNCCRKFFVVPSDTDLGFISKKFGVTEKQLVKWNELDNFKIRKNDVLFLEPKSSSGNVATYKAQSGEDMHDISQKFGIKLSKLYAKNRMNEGQQPKSGQLIYLQQKKPKS